MAVEFDCTEKGDKFCELTAGVEPDLVAAK